MHYSLYTADLNSLIVLIKLKCKPYIQTIEIKERNHESTD